jgi:hypothetical protein
MVAHAEAEGLPFCRSYAQSCEDHLERWQSRLEMERISSVCETPIVAGSHVGPRQPTNPISGGGVLRGASVVKPQGDPDTPRGVFSSGKTTTTKANEN